MPINICGNRLIVRSLLVVLGAVAWLAFAGNSTAQRAAWHDDDFLYRRTIDAPAGTELPSIMVADFYTHGQLRPDGRNLLVYGRRQIVPFSVFQIGPGDYCRVAFQTEEKIPQYYIYYGGEASSADIQRPKWTATEGLLMETRHWKTCDLNSLDEVRKTFAASPRFGADFVPRVFHRHNPFDVKPAPFLTRYSGRINVPLSGKIAFFTSSQDCSFLLIDGKPVVSAPGRHPPEPRAKIKGEIQLEEGPHRFEYFHAAGGNDTCMVAAWQLPGFDKPSQISPSVFGDQRIARVPATRLEHRVDRNVPDFRLAILGDIPSSAEGEPAMVRAQFADMSAKSVTLNAKFHWDFGDGQTSQEQHPGHVYLHPGFYSVTMTVRRGSAEEKIVNRVQVLRSIILEREQDLDKLASYLQMLEKYNALKLDPNGLVQLVRAYLQVEDREKAVRAGKMAFTPEATNHTDATRWDILRLIGPLMRFELDDAKGAAELYKAAAQFIKRNQWRAACAIEAADAYVHDLLQPAEAKPLLEFADGHRRDHEAAELSKLHRVWADWHARSGDGKSARSQYMKAKTARDLSYKSVQQIAWRGAHSRSSEFFLREGELSRMRHEMNRWQLDFPEDKIDGYLSLLQARYWMGLEKFPQAIAVANDLLVVNPNSPYADRLLYLIAQCEEQRKNKARAAAAYQSLVTDYPGSPLVAKARDQIKRLKTGSPTEPLEDSDLKPSNDDAEKKK